MRKYILGTTVLTLAMLTGCQLGGSIDVPENPTVIEDLTEVDPVKPQVDDTIKEPETDIIEPETQTPETEKPENTEVGDNTEAESDVFHPDSDYFMMKNAGGYVSFVECKEGLLEKLPEKYSNYYSESETYFEALVDLDKNGEDDRFIVVNLNEPIYSNGMCGELYVVMDDGKAFNIGTEEYYEYYPELQFYEGEEQNFAILNFANSVTGSDGYVFSGDQTNGMIWFADVPMGMKYINIFGDVVVFEESYSNSYVDGIWIGHTWMPHIFYYDSDRLYFFEYEVEEVSLEEVEEMSPIDFSEITNETTYVDQCYFRENGTLIVITINDINGNLDFTTHFYELAQSGWALVESESGLYIPNEYLAKYSENY